MNGQPNDPQQPRVRQGMDYGEHAEVQDVHAAIAREKREPRVGLEPLSMWLIVVYGLAIFLGGAYLGRYSGPFTGEALDPPVHPIKKVAAGAAAGGAAQELTQFDRGKKVFSANCATCHQMSGTGVAGQYPPLAGSEFVTAGARRPAMIVLKGLQGPLKVKGAQYGTAVMQPWDKTLTDQKIADVLTFIRNEWGNKASEVSAGQISALRKELAGRTDSWNEADILAVPADAELPGGAPPGQPNEASKGAPPPAQPPKPQG